MLAGVMLCSNKSTAGSTVEPLHTDFRLFFARNQHRHMKHFQHTNEPSRMPVKLRVCPGAV